MEKTKKGKKGRSEKGESESDEDRVNSQNMASDDEITVEKKGHKHMKQVTKEKATNNLKTSGVAKPDKKMKGKQKNKDNSDDEDDKEDHDSNNFEVISSSRNKASLFELLQVEDQDDVVSSDEDESTINSNTAGKNKNTKKQGNNHEENNASSSGEEKEEGVKIVQKKTTKKKNKKVINAKHGGGANANEEDLDTLLAELAIDDKKKSEGKDMKKDSKRKTEASAAPVSSITPAMAVTDPKPTKDADTVEIANMTQEEIAKLMEQMCGDDDDDGFKGKKNKKEKKTSKKRHEQTLVAEEMEDAKEEDGEKNEEQADGESTVKTAAQKKKEKKERQKLEKQKAKAHTDKDNIKVADTKAETANKEDLVTEVSTKISSSSETTTSTTIKSPHAVETPVVEKIISDEMKEIVTGHEHIKVAVEDSNKLADATETCTTGITAVEMGEDGAKEEDSKNKKSKKERERERNKKKSNEKEKEEKPADKKPSKMVREMQERLRLIKEEEERLAREEQERIQREEEAIRQREEKARLEREKKEREKQKKKEKVERLKAEGKYLTAKQKEQQRRAQQMLEIMKAQGMEVPQLGATEDKPKKKVVYDSRPKKKKFQVGSTEQGSEETEDTATVEVQSPVEEVVLVDEVIPEPPAAVSPDKEEADDNEEIKDAWDLSTDEEEEQKPEPDKKQDPAVECTSPVIETKPTVPEPSTDAVKKQQPAPAAASAAAPAAAGSDRDDSSESDSDDSGSSSYDSDDNDDDDEEGDGKTAKERQLRLREKTVAMMQKRKEEADAKRSLDILRAPVVCVLGHVDTGKTKILDKLRRTNVQDGEAGGITQQIGATNVPLETIKEQTKMCKEFMKQELKVPGLLIIDTPGHESFSNLRSRGSSLCDIAILVVDIMHGLEPQTIESINLLKSRKTPFIVALNKIDRLFQWQTNPHTDIVNTLKKQKQNTKLEFDERAKSVIVQFNEQGLNAALFYENKKPREYVSMVPTSAITGDGMGNLIALICELTQLMLAKQLMYSEELKATAMEVKALPGLGTTVDVILVNGSLRVGDTIIVAGQEGPIVSQIKALLMPQPLRELRVKSAYEHHKEVKAAQGCKIVAKELERALAGLPVYVAHSSEEVEIYREELDEMLKEVLGNVKVSERGVFVQASTLGSLEALLEFLKTQQIPYAGINIGPVHKRDIMRASVMLEHEPQYATILAFDVKIERDAQEMADSLGVRIFSADIIYHLFDKFMAFREAYKKQKQAEFKHIAVYPCKLKILPQCIFKSRDPIVIGVNVEAGFLKEGTMLCVPSKEFVDIGRVSSIEINHKVMDKATKGQEVCIKIDPIPGEAPKMYGRHFEATDLLVSKISRESIDAVKNYFRDDMSKTDWQLMVELKKTFEIL